MGALSDRMRLLLKYGDLWLVVGLFGTIMLLILPVAPFVLDLLLTISIGLSLFGTGSLTSDAYTLVQAP